MSESFRYLLFGVGAWFVFAVIWHLFFDMVTGRDQVAQLANRRREQCVQIISRVERFYAIHKVMPKDLEEALMGEPMNLLHNDIKPGRPLPKELNEEFTFTFVEAQTLIDSGKGGNSDCLSKSGTRKPGVCWLYFAL